jgi:hypothetical protein
MARARESHTHAAAANYSRLQFQRRNYVQKYFSVARLATDRLSVEGAP